MSDNNTSAIISKVWSFCNPLRDIGVGYGDYLEQLTYLLFLKKTSRCRRHQTFIEKIKPKSNRLRRSRTINNISTYSQIYIQTVFAVKGRESLIQPQWEDQLHKYITDIVQNKEQKMLAINDRDTASLSCLLFYGRIK